jgi:hypothetical protein
VTAVPGVVTAPATVQRLTPRLTGALAPLAAAGALAVVTGFVQRTAGGSPERAVLWTGALFATVAAAWVGGVTILRRRVTVSELALAAVLGVLVLAAAAYGFWASSAIAFRADILLWSESSYVSDVMKLWSGQPLYGAPADLSSFFYTPGSQVVSSALTYLAGLGTSIPALRAVQLLFVVAATLLCTRTLWRILTLAEIPVPDPTIAAPVASVLLFLCATNAVTNPYTHLLHNDALALVVCAAAFAVLVEYTATRATWLVVVAAILPAAGFFVKQSLAIWAPLFGLYFLVFDAPRSWRRVFAYAAGSALALVATYGTCRALWGPNFQYWVVTSMGNHPVSLLRAFQHALDAWPYVAATIGGGAIVVTRVSGRPLLGAWVVSLLLLGAEAYTSGIAWMLNHLGPGSLLGGIWLCAALFYLWPRSAPLRESRTLGSWIPAASAFALSALTASGLGFVRIPLPAVTTQHERYAAAIEREFEGLPAERVLLDAGSWLYVEPGVVMKDRGPAVGELGNNGVGDFSGLLARVRQRYYAKVLVRDYDTPEFVYEHFTWTAPSGIREALRANYRVTRVIPGVDEGWRVPSLHTISVLEPLSP